MITILMWFCLHLLFYNWGGWQVPSSGLLCCDISWNAYQTCRFESNHCFIITTMMKTFLLWPPQKIFIYFSANVRRRFCPNFQRFCLNFQGFFPDFRQIKTFGVRLHPLHPRLLHHWENPLRDPPDTRNIEKAYQELCKSLYLWLNVKSS